MERARCLIATWESEQRNEAVKVAKQTTTQKKSLVSEKSRFLWKTNHHYWKFANGEHIAQAIYHAVKSRKGYNGTRIQTWLILETNLFLWMTSHHLWKFANDEHVAQAICHAAKSGNG